MGFEAFAIPEFISTASAPNSIAIAASEAVPTPASTISGTSVINSYSSNLNGVSAVKALPAQLQEILQEPQNLINAGVVSKLPAGIVEAVRVALADAIHNGFLITLIIGLVLVVGVIMMPSILVKSNRRVKGVEAPNSETPGKSLAEAGMAEGMVTADVPQGKELNRVS